MRKANAILTAMILILFILHGILGAFQMIGISDHVHKILSYTLLVLVLLHTAIGMKFTIDTLRVRRKTGTFYPKENRLFLVRRLSGFGIMILLIFHVAAFTTEVENVTRLQHFDAFRLATQILLVVMIALHVISNVRPLLISFGIRSLKERAFDILFVLTILLLFMTAAFIIYYLRWNV